MTSRDRILKVFKHQEPDHVPIQDSVWGATIDRWRKEGLPQDVNIDDYFGYEMAFFAADCTPRFPQDVIEENETFIIQRTPYGGIRKNFKDYSTTPEIIDWPIKTKEDWLKIKERLYPDDSRVDWGGLKKWMEYHTGKGRFIVYSGVTGYDLLQNYVKSEDLLVLMITEKEWARDMFMTTAKLVMEMCDIMIKRGYHFDGVLLCNDMGYHKTSLFSPQLYKEEIFPADEMLCDYFHRQGMYVMLHCCGNIKVLIPYLIEAGFDCLQPLEVKAGMDVCELKREYGDKLTLMGGIDVRKMSCEDPAVIEEEIASKFEIVKKGGGYIYHSDHSIPKDVSFEQYKRVIELVKKYGKY
jgi:uroporphyrinogen decarboxylase